MYVVCTWYIRSLIISSPFLYSCLYGSKVLATFSVLILLSLTHASTTSRVVHSYGVHCQSTYTIDTICECFSSRAFIHTRTPKRNLHTYIKWFALREREREREREKHLRVFAAYTGFGWTTVFWYQGLYSPLGVCSSFLVQCLYTLCMLVPTFQLHVQWHWASCSIVVPCSASWVLPVCVWT